jgi:Zn-dependent M32 family carboxypeptidase
VGSLYPTGEEFLKSVTGSGLDPAIYIKYLEDKYKALYKL